MPYLIALVALFAVADRFAGGPYIEQLGWRGRPVWYATVGLALWLAVLGHFAAGTWAWPWLALAWFIWREPKWKMFGGSLTPQTRAETFGFFLRHLLFLGAVLAAWHVGRDPLLAAIAVTVWAGLAAMLGVWLGLERDRGRDVNAIVEPVRGALQGLAVATFLLG